jgi:hypothetical protein
MLANDVTGSAPVFLLQKLAAGAQDRPVSLTSKFPCQGVLKAPEIEA